MIVLPIAILMAAAGPAPTALGTPRVRPMPFEFVHDKLDAKMDAAAFKAAQKGRLRAAGGRPSAMPGSPMTSR